MTTQAVTLQLPEQVYVRLQQVAQATRQSLDEVLLRAIQVDIPLVGKTRQLPFRRIWPRWIA
jgi:predicted transcriptional regulator